MSTGLIKGTAANNTLTGTNINTKFYGYAGNDSIVGGTKNDTIYAGEGNDTIRGGIGTNIIDGGDGLDWVMISGDPAGFTFSVSGNTLTISDSDESHIMTNVEKVRITRANNTFIDYDVNAYLTTFYSGKWTNFVSATDGSDWVGGSAASDRMQGDAGIDNFYGGAGNDSYFGNGNNDNVYFDGIVSNYRISRNLNGSINFFNDTYGYDTLTGITGLYFYGSQQWTTVTAALASFGFSPSLSFNVIFASTTGLMNDGTANNDQFEGTSGDNHFRGFAGNDVYFGKAGNDQVNYAGTVADYVVKANANGSVSIQSGPADTDTLYDIEGVYFEGSNTWFGLSQLVSSYGIDPSFNVVFASSTYLMNDGTAGKDWFVGTNGENHFRGFAGDDVYKGKGGYDQVNFAGSAADYVVTMNADGSVGVASATLGSDKLYDIDGVYFEGNGTWFGIQDFINRFANGSGGNTSGSPFDAVNYKQALGLSMKFYYAQYSGDLPANHPVSWRGDSALNDGADVGRNLSGGWYDAGDHVKFGLPMAWSATTLAWGVIDFGTGYQQSNANTDILNHLRWVGDYFMRCYNDNNTASLADDKFYAQVGKGSDDHGYWGSPESMTMARPTAVVSATAPGTEVTAETAAAMAAISMVLKQSGSTAEATAMLDKAKKLFAFSEQYQGTYNDSVPDVLNFYRSWSGYADELCWSAAWLYKATNDVTYLNKATGYFAAQSNTFFSWENKWSGAAALLAQLTNDPTYQAAVQQHIDWFDGISHTPGTTTNGGIGLIADPNSWGSNRYAANTALLAASLADTLVAKGAPTTNAQVGNLLRFAADQIDYMLGDNPNGQSYLIGFGSQYPINPHHRAASGLTGWDAFNSSVNNQHVLVGALVGGPSNATGAWVDSRSDAVGNEVATDYNAGFSGALAALIKYEGII